ncbi:dihydrofolate reductase [Shewanella sp. phage 1/4]|uniref:dihydrofolate reductase n=1 Tax=Shewanella phage 1/4 TaxID=1458859 RepID=UPI0004F76809|nr:dihydrofolate reductase [Shewanella sp. phage 1/4]AHK11148.1 dihydrofolate reductase [Shewanella sp. phage 1/4]
MSIKMIIATGANFEIGQAGKLPWGYIKEDLQYFKDKTLGCPVIMGNTTFKSLPFKGGLPDRYNLVLTRESLCTYTMGNIKLPSVYVSDTLYKVNLKFIENFIKIRESYTRKEADTWVIGGASVYQQLLPYVDEIHWTTVEDIFPEADTYFDMGFLYEGGWERVSDKYLVENMVSVSVWKRK